MVVGGAARVRFGSGAFVLNAGEGMFINAEALHAFDIVGNEGCRMISLVLDYSMLAGREDSVFARRYVMPLVESGAVNYVASPRRWSGSRRCSSACAKPSLPMTRANTASN